LVGFKTPSNNLYCQLQDGIPDPQIATSLRCDIKEMKNPSPQPPPDCPLSWGDAFVIAEGARSGQLFCHGDTVMNDTLLTLAYGSVWQRGPFNCKSEQSGLTCINALGHGFSLSRDHQRTF
jgi:hypothetical protein